jgi:hypothetical protein
MDKAEREVWVSCFKLGRWMALLEIGEFPIRQLEAIGF